ncbi:peptidoglycan-binding domain-containing protein [Pseudodesulfovibrio thermohalotolerans]|uniref:peptidoglycan-binding domain-containing protein n=1 Tax=Pseudodesulfovibrio thermohalotolerans TaxID=2880651 RepID=UPI00244259F7|nr:peptidoglycan-binding domain-containing protein [Pseudodesulfovibrio thermohalotolerans]WFS62154.1 peptidoglycan-binding domain-containing protein [Pseudodesulfovibrio thermohalotolerans]
MNRLFSLIIVSALFALLSACVTTGTNMASTSPDPAFTAEDIANTEVIGSLNLPGHAKVVLAALLLEMRGESTAGLKSAVKFSKDGEHDLRNSFTNYKGYDVALIEIDQVGVGKQPKNGLNMAMGGVFTFMNDIGQTFSERFFADYTIARNGTMVIQNSAATPEFSEFPSVTGFFVKHEALVAAAPKLNSFRDFFLFAMANSIPMNATEEETRNLAQYDTLSFFDKLSRSELLPKTMEGNFAFLCFAMDRMSPVDSFIVKVSKSKLPRGVPSVEPHDIDFPDGYRMAIVEGSAKLYDKMRPFYIHALYKKGGAASGTEQHIGTFSNQKLPADIQRLSVPPGGEWVAEKLSAKTLTAPPRLLNPADREDAKLIQQALAKRGFYKGKIDGLFGKGSQGALRAFRKNTMGSDSAQWDMDVQNRLFN